MPHMRHKKRRHACLNPDLIAQIAASKACQQLVKHVSRSMKRKHASRKHASRKHASLNPDLIAQMREGHAPLAPLTRRKEEAEEQKGKGARLELTSPVW